MSADTTTSDPLEVDLLVPADKRWVSVDDHQHFRKSVATPPPVDEIDQALADPLHDHRPRSAPRHKVNRVLGILDQLDRENSNRRFNT